MTVSDHITKLFSNFHILLNDAAIAEIGQTVETAAKYTSENHAQVTVAILRFAPILLLSPASYSVSENGHSKSHGFNTDGFLKWYALMCKRYGIKDELNTNKPKITFL